MGTPCEIVSVGKRRDGGTKYWCLKHKADATAKYGKPAAACRYADWPFPTEEETKPVDTYKYAGGVALWGAVPAVYDTTTLPPDRGIHVHAREAKRENKVIDETFRSVVITVGKNGSSKAFSISELDAIYFMVSSVFGYEMSEVICTRCGYSHLDKDWFSVNFHAKHLCSGCGYTFKDTKPGVGNPLVAVRNAIEGTKKRDFKKASGTLKIKQADYPFGIQIWGSNPAIVWTRDRKEEEGIHIHGYKDSYNAPYALDGTFKQVEIDGIVLDAVMVRTLMAQQNLPHLAKRLTSINCTFCHTPHFDKGRLAHLPSSEKHCESCGKNFSVAGRLKKTISNPLVGTLDRLAHFAVRPPRKDSLPLLPETIGPL